ncbi:MAG TPA: amidase, partial [Pseudorhizobium sp.]|nr:amidase [Pseudorhizobium sp.]
TALDEGAVTSVGLVAAYLNRIAFYDRRGPILNSVCVLNPKMFEEAKAADIRRSGGKVLSPLDGIPYTAKDSFKAKGLTVAAGSPAFADLIASDDSFAIARLRASGAVLIGLTNMPPVANGGMQRGYYGRAESPYNSNYLTAAYASGSSNGSGTATAASFAAFGLGEETWSSGRAPASNNALCAYTPSRGVISVRGNWPLVPTMDVVVPHTRTMADMLEILDVLVADDEDSRGDFWRSQPWITLPRPSETRPASYRNVARTATLKGLRLGVPAMYINQDPAAGSGAKPGIGGPTGQRIDTRPSVLALWERARQALEAAGAEILVVNFPLVSNYEGDRVGCPTIATRGLVSPPFLHHEILDLSAWSWNDFLEQNGDPQFPNLNQIEGKAIFPQPAGALPDRYHGFPDCLSDYPKNAGENAGRKFKDIPDIEDGLLGLEETRRRDLEQWMSELGLDAVIFPAVADVGPADADTNAASADLAWRNGVWVANGNLAIRHCGVPTVTVPMGIMEDTKMPVGLTFAGRAWDDVNLLGMASAFEATGQYRGVPPRTPPLKNSPPVDVASAGPSRELRLAVRVEDVDSTHERVTVEGECCTSAVNITINGAPIQVDQ